MDDLLPSLIVAVVSGAISSAGTIAALRVHILYIRETLRRQEKEIARAHVRLDHLCPKGAFND